MAQLLDKIINPLWNSFKRIIYMFFFWLIFFINYEIKLKTQTKYQKPKSETLPSGHQVNNVFDI